MIKTFVLKLWKWYKDHDGDASAHHTKYTDAESVSAVLADDQYVRNDIDDETDGRLQVRGSLMIKPLPTEDRTFLYLRDINGNNKYMMGARMGTGASTRFFYYYDYYNSKVIWWWKNDRIDMANNIVKDMKNHADATLSGTPKIVEIDIGGTPYYFKVYPTKT